MKNKPHRLYVYTGGKPYYFPKCITDSVPEMAHKLHCTTARLYAEFHNPNRNKKGHYFIVELTDEEWEEIEEIDRRYTVCREK